MFCVVYVICMYKYVNILSLNIAVHVYMVITQPGEGNSILSFKGKKTLIFTLCFIIYSDLFYQKSKQSGRNKILTNIYGHMANIKRKKNILIIVRSLDMEIN